MDSIDNVKRQHYGKLAGIVGIISNALLCVAKIIIGTISGSIAIIADGVNNLSDASSSVITVVGFRLASLPEDDDHPYGHARIEYITGMIVSVLVVVVGIELLKGSVEKIIHPEPLSISIATIVVLILSILVKVWQAFFYIRTGKKINSTTLIATGTDSRNDVISTFAVLLSALVYLIWNLQIDGYVGCIVAIFIIVSGINLVRETASPLLGETPDDGLVQNIQDMVSTYDGVLGIHDLIVHNYGPGKVFASIHVEVDASTDIMESHDLIDNIEHDIAKSLNIFITAHLDPISPNDPEIMNITPILKEVEASLDGIDNIHDVRIVPGKTHTNVVLDVVRRGNCALSEAEISKVFNASIRNYNPRYFVVINFDKAYTNQP